MKILTKNIKHLEELIKEIENVSYDIRAEVIANELIANGAILQDEIKISNLGQSSRAYRNDILGVKIQGDSYNSNEYLNLLLSRDSIYDTLPEGIVHDLNDGKADKSVNQMIREYKTQKKQEDEARNFFIPFENEIFYYKTQIESAEREFLFKLNGSKPLDFFYQFWGLPNTYPAILVSKFIKLLPFAYKIIGNLDLSCRCLESILIEKVQFKTTSYKEFSDENEQITLGENRLGIDFIIGKNYIDYSINLTLEIGPVTKTFFDDYIHHKELKLFIDSFCEHFFPMEMEVKIVLLMDQETEKFNFCKQPILGYTTRI